ncbi:MULTISPECIES: DUF6415 family natural product biosynthesis protein [unclassified Streptomyces]|uniref:DUF6415 family natural product biosynthesis protein n=1 Tax=unclassified Streptomyces TaxID=2593676 RepID=UPI000DC3C444|nr:MULTISPECIES: DUF6415 family natural product biosynthesis protein [unclassified Streptomyces]MYT68286.1 hypothetical protein [Streptomyces sp. SID8367]RAJ76921.1 hypothetical protein K377_06089 [Streptomyces sp. PsTaAH-137]
MPTIENPPPAPAERMSIPDLLQAALGAVRDRPDDALRARIDLELRVEVRRLLPLVQAQMDATTPRTRAWHARDKAIDTARQELARPIGPSPLAAGIALADLGRSMRTLDEFAGGES